MKPKYDPRSIEAKWQKIWKEKKDFKTEIDPKKPLQDYAYSSYTTYLGKKDRSWIKSTEILGFFKSAQETFMGNFLSYQRFVENYKRDARDVLGELTLD